MIPLCGIFNLGDCLRQAVKAVLGMLFGGMFDMLVEAVEFVMKEAVKFIVGTVGTIWVRVPTVPISGEQNGRFVPSDAVGFVQGRVMWLAMAAATVSLIVAGIRMALSHRGEGLREAAKSLLTFMIVTLFGLAMTTLLVRIGDGMADQFIRDATSTKSFDQRINEAVNGPYQDLTLPLILLLGFAMIVTSIIQMALMFVRNGMLILLIGVLPLAAAATNTEMGKAWFRKLVGWLVAFVAYKPVAALIYAAAIRLFSDDEGGVTGMVRVTTGVTMMVMAVVAMPALIRFVSPKAA
jgi:hypothetical protein